MPLKPVYQASPLLTLKSLPLPAGAFRVRLPWVNALLRLAEQRADDPLLWEGLLRLGSDGPAKDGARQAAEALTRGESVSLAQARAVWALYERQPERALLQALLNWAARLSEEWNIPEAEQTDTLALLEKLYRATGKGGVLRCCQRLVQQMPAWGNLLMAARLEPGEESPLANGEALAEGLRAAALMGMYSGGGTALQAPEAAWEKVTRWNGAVCGGYASAPLLAGKAPDQPVSSIVLGMLTEALALQAYTGKADWASDALERLAVNALPACFQSGMIAAQRVNGAPETVFATEEEQRALAALLRGTAALCASAVLNENDGAAVQILLPGSYLAAGMRIDIAREPGQCTFAFRVREPRQAVLRLRIPAWLRPTGLQLNGKPLSLPRGGWIGLTRTWQPGDVLTLQWQSAVRKETGYHQGVSLWRDDTLLALPGTSREALCGEPRLEQGQVTAPFAPLAEQTGFPVRPRVEEASRNLPLRPYAETAAHTALFPEGIRP